MKIVTTILSIFLILYCSGLRIQLSPFKVSLSNWMMLVGVVFIAIGIAFIALHYMKIGEMKAYDEILKLIKNMKP